MEKMQKTSSETGPGDGMGGPSGEQAGNTPNAPAGGSASGTTYDNKHTTTPNSGSKKG